MESGSSEKVGIESKMGKLISVSSISFVTIFNEECFLDIFYCIFFT